MYASPLCRRWEIGIDWRLAADDEIDECDDGRVNRKVTWILGGFWEGGPAFSDEGMSEP